MTPACSDHTFVLFHTSATRGLVQKYFRLLTVILEQDDYKKVVWNIWNQDVEGYLCMQLQKTQDSWENDSWLA